MFTYREMQFQLNATGGFILSNHSVTKLKPTLSENLRKTCIHFSHSSNICVRKINIFWCLIHCI